MPQIVFKCSSRSKITKTENTITVEVAGKISIVKTFKGKYNVTESCGCFYIHQIEASND